jgi:uncharacterized metal-binding protein YceD (DUF177 family)
MKKLSVYDIEIRSLRPGKHHFEYEVGDAFFESFEYGIVEKGALRVRLELLRAERLLDLHFHIFGRIELVCDRSLERFDYPLDLQEELILKFGDQAEEVDDNMAVIPWETSVLNVADYIYEWVTVAVPMKKLHPKYEETDEDPSDELVYSSERSSDEPEDPRWESLKKLRSKMK